jgi:hypothetical protein
VFIEVSGSENDPSNPMAAGKSRPDRERDPIADLAWLLAQRDASRGSAVIDSRCRQKSASEGRNETPVLPAGPQVPVDLNALEQALKQAYELRECSHKETPDVDDPADEAYKAKVPRRRGLVIAIIGLALVGTAGAFGYRNMFGGMVSPALPPSIKAINELSTIATVNEPQAASSGGARRAGPAITGSIDNMVAQERQQTAVAPSKTDPQASLNGPATPAADQSMPPQAVQGVVMATDPPGPPPTSPVLSSGYAVQVTSERTESRAQSAVRALQAKYPDELGGRQVMIRRADLGAAGIYYRALVGPFASAGKAAKLCKGLKAAGGDCVILKN